MLSNWKLWKPIYLIFFLFVALIIFRLKYGIWMKVVDTNRSQSLLHYDAHFKFNQVFNVMRMNIALKWNPQTHTKKLRRCDEQTFHLIELLSAFSDTLREPTLPLLQSRVSRRRWCSGKTLDSDCSGFALVLSKLFPSELQMYTRRRRGKQNWLGSQHLSTHPTID